MPLAAETLTRDYAILTKQGIASTPEGALGYLKSFIPAKTSPAEAAAFVKRLGSDDYRQREAAVAELIRIPDFPEAVLAAATESNDLEIRWRARTVLEQRGRRDWRSFQAALRILSEQPTPDTLDVVLELSAFYPEETNQTLFHKLLKRVAQEADTPKLLQMGASEAVGKRFAAAVVLETFRPEISTEWFVKIAAEPSPPFALLAAKRLGNKGDRRALAALVRLVGAEDRAIAEESACFLQMLCRHEFRLPANHEKEQISTLVTNLKQWLQEQGPNVALHFPVLESAIQRGDLAGNTLVSTGSLGRVLEITPSGKEVWSYPANAWSVEKLRKGTVLIASYQANQIVEVNQEGKVVWRMDGINAMRAKPLADDHILIAHFSGRSVVELNAERQQIWSRPTPDNCFDAERLPNGNTVFACPNLIREITPAGETVHSLEVEGRVNGLQVLPTGDKLLANYGKNQVQQFDSQGKLVWHFDEPQPNDAFRLKNGNTLITSATRSIEVDSAGNIVRTVQLTNYGCARQ